MPRIAMAMFSGGDVQQPEILRCACMVLQVLLAWIC